MGEKKIPTGVAALMIGVAFTLDLMNIILEFISLGLLGWLIDLISTTIFSVWFYQHDINLWAGRNFMGTAAAVILDAIPVGDMFFPWTLRVAYTSLTERHPAAGEEGGGRERPRYRL